MSAPERQVRCEHGFYDAQRICPSCNRKILTPLHKQATRVYPKKTTGVCKRCLRVKSRAELHTQGTRLVCVVPCHRERDGTDLSRPDQRKRFP